LSKPKPRLIVLIMVFQHIQIEVLIHLVPKILEPNKFEIKYFWLQQYSPWNSKALCEMLEIRETWNLISI